MKKLLSILLCLFLLTSQLSVISQGVDAESLFGVFEKNVQETVSVDEFSEDISEMINKFDDLEIENGTDESYRLIVKSDDEEIDPLDSLDYIKGFNDLHILQFKDEESMDIAFSYYESLETVEYVQEDSVLEAAELETENTVIYENAISYPTSVPSNIFGYTNAKNNMSTSSEVTVAVVDSGVQNDHEFLIGRVEPTGFNSINEDGTCYDDRGHGTQVAGIIAANTKENVKIKPYKVLNQWGKGSETQVSLGVYAAIEDGVDIINLSLSMQGHSTILEEACQAAYDAGVIVVVAAGNAGNDIGQNYYSPGSFDTVLSIVACNNSKRPADFSNYGSVCDFAAPGVDILSSYLDNSYKISSGTSVASPFICAAVSYLLAETPEMTFDEVYAALEAQSVICYGNKSIYYVRPDTVSTVSGTVSTPVFNYADSSFIGSLVLSISCATADAQILYQLNNTESVFKQYSSPITITDTSTVSAIAIKSGMNNSSSKSATFTKIDLNADDFIVDENGVLVGYSGTAAELVIPTYINGKQIYSIGDNAFKDNTNITSVALDKNITSIGADAFSGCTNLTTFTAEGVTAIGDFSFYNCTALSTVKLPLITMVPMGAFKNAGSESEKLVLTASAITEIGNEAFYGSSIQSLTLSKLTTIGEYSFANCRNLSAVTASGVTSIGVSAFENCEKLSSAYYSQVTSIPDKCFKGCSKLSSTSFTNATSIGVESFSGCSSFTSLSFANCKTLGNKAFDGCSEATKISLPSIRFDLTDTPSSLETFAGCTKVTSVNVMFMQVKNLATLFPEITYFSSSNVGGVPDYAFQGCYKLATINLPALSSAGAYAFADTVITSVNYTSLATIGDYCFSGIETLKTVTLPALTEITTENCHMFAGTNNITSMTLAGLTKVGAGFNLQGKSSLTTFSAVNLTNLSTKMFKDCTSLNSVSLTSVETVGSYAFENCGLEKLTLTKTYTLNDNAFANNPNFTSISIGTVPDFDLNVFSGSEENITYLSVGGSYISANIDNGEKGFSRFPNLQTLYYSVPTVETGTISNCANLTALYVNKATVLEENSINNCPSLESFYAQALVDINSGAFTSTRNIKTLTINSVTDASQISSAFNLGAIVSIEANGLTEIPTSFMANKTNLQTVKMQSLKSVPTYAFRNCTSLKSVSLSSNTTSVGDYAFSGCSALTSFSCHGSLKTIGRYAFAETALTTITTSNTFMYVTTVGYGAFKDCTNLKTVAFRDATTFGANVFEGCSAMTSATLTKATSLGNYLFKDCVKLTTVSLPAMTNLKSTGLFEGCISLKTFTSESVLSLGESFFKDCTALQSVTLTALTTIPDNCFNGCGALSSLTIPAVTTIGDYAFKDCTSLNELYLLSVTILGANVFEGCTALTTVSLDEMASVPAYCFTGCTNLTEVTIPMAETIGEHAFDSCINLSEVDLSAATQIGNYAFYNCDALTTVSSAATTELGEYSFSECEELIYANFNNVTYIPEGCFMNCPNFTRIGKKTVSNVTGVGAYAFKDCLNFDIEYLDVEIIETLGSYAFDNIACTDDVPVEYNFAALKDADANAFEGLNISVLKLESIEYLSDLPDCDFIVISNFIKQMDTDRVTTATVCVHKGYTAWTYCMEKDIPYAIIGSEEAMVKPIDKEYYGYDNYISFEPIGFNTTYQWYATNNADGTNAVLVEGATENKICPAEVYTDTYDEGKYKYFFCEFTIDENGTQYTYTSPVSKNLHAVIQGTEETLVDHIEGLILTDSTSNVNDITKIMDVEDGYVDIVASYENGNTKSYGTGTQVSIKNDEGEIQGTYTLIVYGDVNCDGVVDVLDSALMANAMNGHTTFEIFEAVAADIVADAYIGVDDYQQVVNKSVA